MHRLDEARLDGGISVGCGFNAQCRQIFPRSPSDSAYVGSSSSIAAVSKPMP
jgi:hypothetical protein